MTCCVIWTKEQNDALRVAKTGHNLCIFGKSGCGKSTIIKEIHRDLSQDGRNCQLVCPSGVSCQVYNNLATTVNSFYGLQTAELPVPLLIQRSLERKDIVKQIQSVEVLIWDEISMSSSRIFHIVDLLHQKVLNNSLPFGGIQIILGGDFCQLKPIQNSVDPGDPIYKSVLFGKVFPHRIVLEKVKRQNESEEMLKKALDCLRVGICDDETEEYLRGLSRNNLAGNSATPPIHIFFKKLPVDVHNLFMLSTLPGEILKYESIDTGRAGFLKDSIPKVLYVKRGCEVMLLFNINNSLKNGTRGTFVGPDTTDSTNSSLLLQFPNVGEVAISRKTWYVYNKNGQVQASRTQYPLTPSYAITVHKAQSATMESAVVHCSQEFDAGQTYVAVSRVRSEKNIKIVGFQKRFLLKQPRHITEIHTTQHGDPVPSFSCCRNVELQSVNCELDLDEEPRKDDNDVYLDDKDMLNHDEHVRKFFATNQGKEENFSEILQQIEEHKDPFPSTRPPSFFNVKTFLESLTKDKNTDNLSESIKEAARYGLENLELFELLTRVLWCRVKVLFDGYLPKNAQEEEVRMSALHFTQVTTKLNELFLTNDYRSDIMTAFNLKCWSDSSCGHRSLGAQLLFQIYQMFIAEIGKSIQSREQIQTPATNVSDMGPDGRGKVRYVGGWAIRKLLEKSRRYVVQNKCSASEEVVRKVVKEMRKICLLEDNIIFSSEVMQETCDIPETLQVTESRQYRERGLLNISDSAYEFFMLLEQQRINHINSSKLVELGTDLVNDSVKTVAKNDALENVFTRLFCLDNAEDKVLVSELFKEVVTRYLRMGAGQFIRDFRKEYQLKKSLAHRKAVLQRAEKAKTKKMKLHIPQIEQDHSNGKQLSHLRLCSLVDEVKAEGLKALYSKKELQKLCDAYGVQFIARWNKTKLANELTQSIIGHESMPFPYVLASYRAVLVGEDQADRVPIIRITRL